MFVLLTVLVERRVSEQGIIIMLSIIDGINDNRQTCKEHIKELVEDWIKQTLA